MRSGHLSDISSEDINYLTSKRLGSIIDLRTPEESSDEPDRLIIGAHYRPIPIFRKSILGITHEMKGKSLLQLHREYSAERMRSLIPDMPKLYQSMITDIQALEQLSEVMHEIIRNTVEQKSTLFHCTVGKDRTGVVSALLLSMLDVDEETITQDYLRSNAAIRLRAKLIYLVILVFKKNAQIASELCNAYLVQKANILAVFDVIRQQFGTFDNFFREGLHIGDGERELFQHYALEA